MSLKNENLKSCFENLFGKIGILKQTVRRGKNKTKVPLASSPCNGFT